MTKALWTLAKLAYKLILRRVLVKAIDNPDNDIDDIIIEALDRLFGYNG